MKSFLSKVGLGAVALSACFLVSSTQAQVYSVNVVGFNKTTIGPGDLTMYTTPFLVDTQTVAGVITNQLTGGLDDLSSDVIYIWDGSTYKTLILAAGAGAPYDDNWYDLADLVNFPNLTPDQTPLGPGGGVWVKNNQSVTQEVVAVGEVVTNLTKDVVISGGLQMISYPYSSSFNLGTNTTMLASGATAGFDDLSADIIYRFDDDAQAYNQNWLLGVVGIPAIDNSWVDVDLFVVSGDTADVTLSGVIDPGEAFWYAAQAGYTWTESIPYTLD